MTRHTAMEKRGRAPLRLDVTTERDETSGYRHKWTTTVRLGLLSASGPNLRAALAGLEAELLALACSEAAASAVAAERMRALPLDSKNPDKSQRFVEGQAIEVSFAAEDGSDDWIPAEYGTREGSLHRVWMLDSRAYLVVDDDRVREANRPSLADVG